MIFQDGLDIILEMRLRGVAEQEYTGLYWKSQLKSIAGINVGDIIVTELKDETQVESEALKK